MSLAEKITQQGVDHLNALKALVNRLEGICNSLTGAPVQTDAPEAPREGVYGLFNVLVQIQSDSADCINTLNHQMTYLEESIGIASKLSANPPGNKLNRILTTAVEDGLTKTFRDAR